MSGLEQSTRMAWAVRSETGSIVHVSMLGKAQKGLLCGCVCPSCKGTLQAVNVDKDATHFAKPNTRGQFFRHASGQQTHGCAIIAARMAALQLLYAHDLIILPAPTRRVAVRGASGHQYVGLAHGERLQAKVRYRVWVDEQTARLTLDDGHVIQIQLSSVREFNSEGVHGVIEIRIDDPEVSSWTPQQILERATLDGETSCWIRHWDDQALSDTARRDAEEQAADNSDLIPSELAHLVGQATSMLSESVLHWAVKEILAQAQSVRTPSHVEQITSTYPSHISLKGKPLHWTSETLQLSQATLEQRVGNVIPDIRCQAHDSSGNAFDLFVEVVVTNPVSEQKLVKIREIGSACLEIDLRKLRISGRVKREKLRQEVLYETDLKTWLHHPLIYASRQLALQSLNVDVQRQEELFQKRAARNEGLQSMRSADLLQEFALTLRWQWSDSNPEPDAWTAEELTTSLITRGFSGLSHQTLLSKHGLLWHLETIRSNKSSRGRITDMNPAELFSMAMRDISISPYITLLVRAIQRYRPPMSTQQRKFLEQSFAVIRTSIDRGEHTYARPNTYDSLVSAIYPELAADIADVVGTIRHAKQLQQELAEKRRQDERSKQEARTQQQLIEQEEASRLAADKAERDYRAALEELSVQEWNQDRGMTRYSEQAQKNVTYLGRGEKRKLLFDKFALVDSAWKARERGQPFADWLAIQEPKTAGNLQDCTEFLVAARLVL